MDVTTAPDPAAIAISSSSAGAAPLAQAVMPIIAAVARPPMTSAPTRESDQPKLTLILVNAPAATVAQASQAASLPASGAAGRVFAAALHAAAAPASAAKAGDDHDPVVAAMLAGSAAAVGAVVAVGQSATIDLKHEGWPARMAEQIEALRDAADAASTTVRVSPDALGPVDLQVRRDGDRLHVHFTAANPETRALIADAQPQLAAAAADRGLKLGQTSVGAGLADAGAGGQSRRGDSAGRQPATPARPAPALSAASDPDADDRIA